MSSKSYRSVYDGKIVNIGGNYIDYNNDRMDRDIQSGEGGSL
jgi:hypothetical protein